MKQVINKGILIRVSDAEARELLQGLSETDRYKILTKHETPTVHGPCRITVTAGMLNVDNDDLRGIVAMGKYGVFTPGAIHRC